MAAQTPLPNDDPRMTAWSAYKATDEFVNTERWAKDTQIIHPHLDGSLWAVFVAGYEAGQKSPSVGGIGKIEQPQFGEHIVACVVCRQKKPVLLYPHRLDGSIVGWVFVCAEDQETIQGADISIVANP